MVNVLIAKAVNMRTMRGSQKSENALAVHEKNWGLCSSQWLDDLACIHFHAQITSLATVQHWDACL